MNSAIDKLHLAFDLVQTTLLVSGVVGVAVVLTGAWWPGTGQMVVGGVIFVLSLFALPSLVVLWVSPPPQPLSQRSALVAGAAWFCRTVVACMVFAFSVVAGSVAGVIASSAAEDGDGAGAVNRAWVTLTTIALPPALVFIALALVVMGLRWLIDLGRLIEDGSARRVVAQIEFRWTGRQSERPAAGAMRSGIELAVDFGRAAVMALVLAFLLIAAFAIHSSVSAVDGY